MRINRLRAVVLRVLLLGFDPELGDKVAKAWKYLIKVLTVLALVLSVVNGAFQLHDNLSRQPVEEIQQKEPAPVAPDATVPLDEPESPPENRGPPQQTTVT